MESTALRAAVQKTNSSRILYSGSDRHLKKQSYKNKTLDLNHWIKKKILKELYGCMKYITLNRFKIFFPFYLSWSVKCCSIFSVLLLLLCSIEQHYQKTEKKSIISKGSPYNTLTTWALVISEDLMVNHFLPGLKCLRTDMEHLSPEHEVSSYVYWIWGVGSRSWNVMAFKTRS